VVKKKAMEGYSLQIKYEGSQEATKASGTDRSKKVLVLLLF
jgi:hypothetical protein